MQILRDRCFLYAVGKLKKDIAFQVAPESPLITPTEEISLTEATKLRTPDLIKLFNRIKKDKKWIIETTSTQEFNEDDREIHNFDEEPTISKRVTTTTKTEYFIDDSLDIEEYRPDKM